MNIHKNYAPAVGAARALDNTAETTPIFCHNRNFVQEGEKALAVWLYNIGARSLEETQRAFDVHPEWVDA